MHKLTICVLVNIVKISWIDKRLGHKDHYDFNILEVDKYANYLRTYMYDDAHVNVLKEGHINMI
jgi:hypothetical protein